MNSLRSTLQTSQSKFFMSCRWLLAAASLGLTSQVHAALAGTDFQADIDGWLGYSCINPGNCTAVPPGGNLPVIHTIGGGSPPGGGAPEAGNNYIETVDPGEDHAARVEPNPVKYNSLYQLGNTLSFDVRVDSGGGGGVYSLDAFGVAPLVAIEAPGALLVYTTGALPVIDGDWKHYDVPLVNGADWFILAGGPIANPDDATFAAVLGALTRLTIISEWLKEGGEVDSGAVDNFQVVPLPAALPLLGVATLFLGLKRRKKVS